MSRWLIELACCVDARSLLRGLALEVIAVASPWTQMCVMEPSLVGRSGDVAQVFAADIMQKEFAALDRSGRSVRR